ncbi:MAG: ParB/RepB/Spo0J family partition protein [Pegethrix bostrychoides GSE-TBD4-15B]|jgi:ParB family chromosome partitioning protein|uniref:ParB/RepB/Spo0J family partition protein n=1 Tax=Pegethrix bostrychoides GSE-TBD4-15B TaxID=2839662 RepID=A0A951P9V8_9CYAN|nr:ParB/RepB/Spo0J family partition protein [Pegethrix bostrychoides GSE-TBD4-15B]
MAIKLSEALQGMKARIADLELESISPSEIDPREISPSFDHSGHSAAQHSNQTALLKLSEIIVAPDRIRQYFDSAKTASLVQSIQRYGFRGVLWVRRKQGQHHLVAGGRRYAACQQAGLVEVPVEIWEINDAEAIQLELLENFQREDLNPIEETEGILRMLEVTLHLPRPEIVALLNRRSRQQREFSTDTGVRAAISAASEAEQTIEDLFKVIGRFSPESFRTHRLPLLNLPQPLIKAIQTGQMEYSKARLIGRVKDPDTRDALLEQAIAANWSRQQINQQIRTVEPAVQPQSQQARVKIQAKALLKQLSTAELDERTAKKLGKLLAELKLLLN